MVPQEQPNSFGLSPTATAVLNTLASQHSRRSYQYAIDRFIEALLSRSRRVIELTSPSLIASLSKCTQLPFSPVKHSLRDNEQQLPSPGSGHSVTRPSIKNLTGYDVAAASSAGTKSVAISQFFNRLFLSTSFPRP
jgi:hypothetical protein